MNINLTHHFGEMENQEKDLITHNLYQTTYEAAIHTLKTTSWKSQDEVTNFLAPLGEDEGFGFLISAFQEPEVLVRSKALEVIGYIYSLRYLNLVMTAISDADSHICEQANKIIATYPPDEISYEDFVPALNFFSTKTYFEKSYIRNFLNSLGNNKAFELISKALKDPIGIIRSHALWGLFYIYSSQYLDLVIASMRDEASQIRSQAITFFPEKKIENDKIIEALIEALNDENSHVRYDAIYALGKYKAVRAVEPLLKFLQDEDGYVIRHTAQVLAEIGDKRAVQPIIDVLERRPIFLDLEDGTRTGLVADGEIGSALAEFKDPRSYIPITKLLSDKDLDVRATAAWALRKQGDARAVDLLVAALEDEEEDVRSNAASALGDIGSKRAVEPLIRALKDKSFHVREDAAFALGLLKDTRAIEPLIRALKNNSHESHPTNYSVMEKPGLIRVIESNEHTRGTAAYALGLLGDKSVTQALLNLLAGESYWVMKQTVEGLGILGDIRALEPLKMIKTNNQDLKVAVAKSVEQIEKKN